MRKYVDEASNSMTDQYIYVHMLCTYIRTYAMYVHTYIRTYVCAYVQSFNQSLPQITLIGNEPVRNRSCYKKYFGCERELCAFMCHVICMDARIHTISYYLYTFSYVRTYMHLYVFVQCMWQVPCTVGTYVRTYMRMFVVQDDFTNVSPHMCYCTVYIHTRTYVHMCTYMLQLSTYLSPISPIVSALVFTLSITSACSMRAYVRTSVWHEQGLFCLFITTLPFSEERGC